MSKYYCYLFNSFEELQKELKKVTKKHDALIIAQSLAARLCPSHWIREAYNRYFEISRMEQLYESQHILGDSQA